MHFLGIYIQVKIIYLKQKRKYHNKISYGLWGYCIIYTQIWLQDQ